MTQKNKGQLYVGPTRHCKGGNIRFVRYLSGELAMWIVKADSGEVEAIATVSLVPYGAEHPGQFGVWLKGWTENEGIPEALERWGIVKLTGRKYFTGFVEAQHAELTETAREYLPKEDERT